VPGVAHLLYLYDQRPHTDRALIRHDLRPNVIAIGKDRCARRLAGIHQIRRIGQRKFSEPMVPIETIVGPAMIRDDRMAIHELAANEMRRGSPVHAPC
jgi:hypothetical protein